MSGLRELAAPFVALGPSGVTARTRLKHLTADDEKADLGLTLREDPRDPAMLELASDAAVDLDNRVAYYLDPSGHLVGLDLGSGEVRWRGQVRLPKSPVEGGVAPELMLHDHRIIGQIGGQLFRIEPVLPEAGS